MRQLAGLNHRGHQGLGLFGNAKTEVGVAGGKARDAQHAQRIFTKRGRDMAQQALTEIVLSAVGVDNCAVGIWARALTVRSRRSRSASRVTSGAA